MLSYTTKERLASLLEIIAENEQKLESIRQVLSEIINFNPLTAFNRLDLSSDGSISPKELTSFFYDNNQIITHHESQQIINYFDIQYDDFNFNKFLQIILPKRNDHLRNSVQNRCIFSKSKKYQPLPYEQGQFIICIEWALSRFFQQALKNIKSFNTQKQLLFQSADFTINEAFNAIDYQHNGFFTKENVDYFLAENRHALNYDSLINLMETFDKNDTGKVFYNFFAQFLENDRNDYQIYDSIRYKPKYQETIKNQLKSSLKHSLKESKILSSDGKFTNTYTSNLKKSINPDDQEYKDYLYKSQIRLDSANKYESLKQSIKSITPLKQDKIFYRQDQDMENLFQTFKYAILEQRKVEKIKELLSQRIDFNFFDAFRVFDYKGKGYINFYEFLNYLRDFDIFDDQRSISLLFKHLDIQDNGSIQFSEFQSLIQPNNKQYCQILKQHKPNYIKNQQEFTRDTNRYFRELIDSQIQKEKHFQDLRIQLDIDYINAQKLFMKLDNLNKGYLNKQDFNSFLEQNRFQSTLDDIKALFQRFDKNNNRKITYQEFVEELQIKQTL